MDMASHRVLGLALVGLVLVHAVYSGSPNRNSGSASKAKADERKKGNAKPGQGVTAKVAVSGGGTNVRLKQGMRVNIAGGGKDQKKGSGEAVAVRAAVDPLETIFGRLIRAKGRLFFRLLTAIVPRAVELLSIIAEPRTANPETINKLIAEYTLTLSKMVSEGTLTMGMAWQLRQKMIEELKFELQGKINVDLIGIF